MALRVGVDGDEMSGDWGCLDCCGVGADALKVVAAAVLQMRVAGLNLKRKYLETTSMQVPSTSDQQLRTPTASQ